MPLRRVVLDGKYRTAHMAHQSAWEEYSDLIESCSKFNSGVTRADMTEACEKLTASHNILMNCAGNQSYSNES